jgi:hypothetical protein
MSNHFHLEFRITIDHHLQNHKQVANNIFTIITTTTQMEEQSILPLQPSPLRENLITCKMIQF